MFSGFKAIAYKEFLHVIRDPATRFVFIIPIMQLVLFGYAIDLQVKDIPTSIVDLDGTEESRELADMLENTRSLEVTDEYRSLEELEEALVNGTTQVGVYIPDGFARRVRRGEESQVLVLIDGSYSTEATAALNVTGALGLYISRNVRAVEWDTHEMGRLPPNAPLANIDIRQRLLFNPNLRSPNFFVPGLVGVILQLITILLTSFSIVRERESGTFEQLMVTPVGPWGLFLGKLVPYAGIAIIETTVVLVLMVFAFGVPIVGSLPLLAVLSLLFLLTSLSLGVIISTLASNQAEAMQFSFLLLLPSILLSGFVFPLQTIPDVLQPLTYLIPVRYFIEILRGLILRGAPFEALWMDSAALAIFTIALLVVSAIRFKKRLD